MTTTPARSGTTDEVMKARDRLLDALEKIHRMRVLHDDAVNRITLAAAIEIARAALGEEK